MSLNKHALTDYLIQKKVDYEEQNLIPSIALLLEDLAEVTGDYVSVDSEDHDCHADTPEGHCDHPSHGQAL
jgi:hypothetical protein